MNLPSVIALKNFIKPSDNPNFTRFNVFKEINLLANIAEIKKI